MNPDQAKGTAQMDRMAAEISAVYEMSGAVQDEADAVASEALALAQELGPAPTSDQPVAVQLQSLAQHLENGGQRCRLLLDQAAVMAGHQALIQQVHDQMGRLTEAIRTQAAPKPPVPSTETADQK